MKENKIIDQWIKELKEAGLTYDQMIEIFRLAKEKLKDKQDNRVH